MKRYRAPGFQERIALAARARNDALTQLRAKPPLDEAVAAERAARRMAKDAAAAEKRNAARLAADEIKAAKRAKAAETAASRAPARSTPTDAERKAMRDARYLARKNRATS